jgi:hypothetical protein
MEIWLVLQLVEVEVPEQVDLAVVVTHPAAPAKLLRDTTDKMDKVIQVMVAEVVAEVVVGMVFLLVAVAATAESVVVVIVLDNQVPMD